jgi:hypothetical protein
LAQHRGIKSGFQPDPQAVTQFEHDDAAAGGRGLILDAPRLNECRRWLDGAGGRLTTLPLTDDFVPVSRCGLGGSHPADDRRHAGEVKMRFVHRI